MGAMMSSSTAAPIISCGQARGTMIRPSLRRTPETASIKESAGLPWGCVLMPLAPAASFGSADTDKYASIGAEDEAGCAGVKPGKAGVVG